MNGRSMTSAIAEKMGRQIALAVGVMAEIVVATVGISAAGTIWLREHWLEPLVGLGMWLIVSGLFGMVCGFFVESRITRRWVWTACCLILFLSVAIFLILCRIDIDCYLRPIMISMQRS